MMIIPAAKVIAVGSAAVIGSTVPAAIILLLRRVADSVGIAEPTQDMLKTENSAELLSCPLFRHFPALADKLAWRSLGAVKTPIHTCRFPSSDDVDGDNAEPLEFLVKREDLISPLYGGNKVRTLQHQLAVCESRRERGESSFDQLVSIGTGGSNQVLATVVHAQTLGWNTEKGNNDSSNNIIGPRINPCWLDSDAPDFDNTLNMLSVLSFSNSIGWTYNWGDLGSSTVWKILAAVGGAWKQDAFVPMMLGGNCPAGVLGQVGGMLELAEQIDAGDSPDPGRIYLPVGSSCTVSGLVVGAVLARRLGMKAFSNPDFEIVGCNVHPGLARLDAVLGFHTNPVFGIVPLTITHTVKAACAALSDLGGPDIQADAMEFVRTSVSIRAGQEVVGDYGAHSELTRSVAKLYDEQGTVVDNVGAVVKRPLWVCGHFVGKALAPLLQDLKERAAADGSSNKIMPYYMLWMTKSAVQPRGNIDEWPIFLKENEVVKEWANEGKAESILRPGRVSTVDGLSSDYRAIMTKVS